MLAILILNDETVTWNPLLEVEIFFVFFRISTMIVRALLRRKSILERICLIYRIENASFSLDTTETRHDSPTDDWKTELTATMKVIPDFITPQEEDSMLQEVEPYMKRLRYEFSHWDGVSKFYSGFQTFNHCIRDPNRQYLNKFHFPHSSTSFFSRKTIEKCQFDFFP